MADNKQKPQAPRVEKANSTNGTKAEVKKDGSVTTQSTTQKTMFEKTQPQTTNEGTTPWLKILAIGALIFGLVVLLAILLLVVITRISPRVDSTLPVPVLKELPAYTNSDKIVIEGTAEQVSQVIIFVDDKQDSTFVNVDSDGKFSYEYTFPSEKLYKFEAAGLTGTIVKSRSDKSNSVEITFDKTAPSKSITIDQSGKTVDTDKVTVKGKADPNSTVTLKKDDKSYTGVADKDGNFEVKDVQLSKGENVFKVEIKDPAGNTVKADDLKLTYSTGSLNGSGATSSSNPTLPNSAGVIDDAIAALGQNNIMFGFGLFALVLFVVNSAIVAVKLKKQQ